MIIRCEGKRKKKMKEKHFGKLAITKIVSKSAFLPNCSSNIYKMEMLINVKVSKKVLKPLTSHCKFSRLHKN